MRCVRPSCPDQWTASLPPRSLSVTLIAGSGIRCKNHHVLTTELIFGICIAPIFKSLFLRVPIEVVVCYAFQIWPGPKMMLYMFCPIRK